LAPPFVRFGSKADVTARISDVRFAPESKHASRQNQFRLCAKKGHFPQD
jgi:hypothetical protein